MQNGKRKVENNIYIIQRRHFHLIGSCGRAGRLDSSTDPAAADPVSAAVATSGWLIGQLLLSQITIIIHWCDYRTPIGQRKKEYLKNWQQFRYFFVKIFILFFIFKFYILFIIIIFSLLSIIYYITKVKIDNCYEVIWLAGRGEEVVMRLCHNKKRFVLMKKKKNV